jgi:hypothetical protein
MIRAHSLGLILLVLSLWPAVEATQAQSKKKPSRVKEPAWFTAPPKDTVNLIVRGKAEAPDMQLAIDKAGVAARGDLASKVDSSWQKVLGALGKEMPECGRPSQSSTEVTLTGTKIREQKTVKKGKKYTAYVLISWPNASFAAALLARAKEDTVWYDSVKDAKVIQGLSKTP